MSERSEEDMAFLVSGGLCQLRDPNFELEKREIRRTSYSLRERAILRLNMY